MWINGLSRPGVHEAVAHAIATNGTPHDGNLVPKLQTLRQTVNSNTLLPIVNRFS